MLVNSVRKLVVYCSVFTNWGYNWTQHGADSRYYIIAK